MVTSCYCRPMPNSVTSPLVSFPLAPFSGHQPKESHRCWLRPDDVSLICYRDETSCTVSLRNGERIMLNMSAEEVEAKLWSPPLDPDPPADRESEGVRRIRRERERHAQICWTDEHDDEHHSRGELAMAAAVYATPGDLRIMEWKTTTPPGEFPSRGDASWQQPRGWPFGPESFKPGDRIRELEKAGALIAAEIDRLLRAQKGSSSSLRRNCWSCRWAFNDTVGCNITPSSSAVESWVHTTHRGSEQCPSEADGCPGWEATRG